MNGRHRAIRVLHLRDSPWLDGPGRTILETASHIDRSRIDYHVGPFVPEAGASHPFLAALRERKLPAHPIVDDGGSIDRVARQVMNLMDTHEFDILHASELRSTLVALKCRRYRHVKVVRTAHGWIANDVRGRTRAALDRALLVLHDRVIFVSEAMRRGLPQRWMPNRRARVIHNAVVPGRFGDSAPIEMAWRGHGGEVARLACIGRLSPEKGQALLLRAVAALAKDHPEISLTLAGSGPQEEELRRLAANLAIGDRVRFPGYVSDIRSVYSDASVVIQSSLTEGLPNVVLEAASLGIPVIATDVGGTAEVIAHEVTGYLVMSGSVSALVSAIRQYLENPEHFVELARTGRERVNGLFCFEARTAAQSSLYEELSGGPA